MYHSFKDMPVWQHALKLSVEVFNLTKILPISENYGLTSQTRRSSNSVTGNIAEAFGRKTNKDKSNFYVIAKGSAYETQSHLIYGQKVGYLDTEKTEQINNEYNNLIHELNKILKTLNS
jgi:four helix bundle protein